MFEFTTNFLQLNYILIQRFLFFFDFFSTSSACLLILWKYDLVQYPGQIVILKLHKIYIYQTILFCSFYLAAFTLHFFFHFYETIALSIDIMDFTFGCLQFFQPSDYIHFKLFFGIFHIWITWNSWVECSHLTFLRYLNILWNRYLMTCTINFRETLRTHRVCRYNYITPTTFSVLKYILYYWLTLWNGAIYQ